MMLTETFTETVLYDNGDTRRVQRSMVTSDDAAPGPYDPRLDVLLEDRAPERVYVAYGVLSVEWVERGA